MRCCGYEVSTSTAPPCYIAGVSSLILAAVCETASSAAVPWVLGESDSATAAALNCRPSLRSVSGHRSTLWWLRWPPARPFATARLVARPLWVASVAALALSLLSSSSEIGGGSRLPCHHCSALSHSAGPRPFLQALCSIERLFVAAAVSPLVASASTTTAPSIVVAHLEECTTSSLLSSSSTSRVSCYCTVTSSATLAVRSSASR